MILEFPNTNTHNTMPYNNFVSLEYAINELDLFDNIKFKYLKDLFTKDTDLEDWGFEVDIEDIALPYSSANCCMRKTEVKYELENPEYKEGGFYPYQKEKYYSFTKEYEYNSSSAYGFTFMNLYEESEDEEEESEEEEENMSSTNLINELKELFGKRVWTRNDEDFLTTSKEEYLENKCIDCVIECEGEYNDLQYYEHYSGTDIFRKLLKKYGRSMDWADSCIVNIYDDSKKNEEEDSEED